MSLITRCPACGTMFNVVADQLKVSQGWVRCGQCADVFDATLHLQNDTAPAPPQAIPDVQFQPLLSAATPYAATATSYVSYAEEVSAALTTPDDTSASTTYDAAAPLFTHAVEAKEPEFTDVRDDVSSEVPHDAPNDVASDVSFVRDARRQAFWRKPLTRAALGLSAVLLFSLLVLQAAVMQRDKLAAFEPRLKPALQMLCDRLACNVGPVRQIEAIVIESSSFNKVNDEGIYRLAFSLKNTGLAAVAIPSLEVTLTDTQDQPVLRRVLSPAQFNANNSMLAAGADFSSALSLQISANPSSAEATVAPGASLRVAGYRLLAFYP